MHAAVSPAAMVVMDYGLCFGFQEALRLHLSEHKECESAVLSG
jgi:hypothetical protein